MANENIKEFTQDIENKVEDVIPVEIEKQHIGLWKRFLALKTWQKIAVVTILTGAVAGGAFLVYKLIIEKPEVVAEAIDTVTENSIETVAEVIGA